MVQADKMKIEIEKPKRVNGTYGNEYKFKTAKGFYFALLNFDEAMGGVSQDDDPAMDGLRRWVFRGQWDSTKGLIPTAFRKKSYEKLVPRHSQQNLTFIENKPSRRPHVMIDQISLECSLLRQFMETANDLGIKCNYNLFLNDYMKKIQSEYYAEDEIEQKKLVADKKWMDDILKWPQSEIYPLMSLAQHHGIPTRLLDFSYNPLLAMFFAASSPFFKECINDNKEIDKEGELCVWAISEKAQASISLRKIPAPSNRSGNIFAQEGVLITDTEANNNFITDGEWHNFKNLMAPKVLIKLTLPQNQYKDLLRYLWNSNITPARIMPNIDKVTETLKYIQWLSV